MESNNYYDDAIIKLKRKYGKDELVLTLSKELSVSEIENGKLKSYIHELEDEARQYCTLKKSYNKLILEIKNAETYLKLEKKVKKLEGEIKTLREANSLMANQLCTLKNK